MTVNAPAYGGKSGSCKVHWITSHLVGDGRLSGVLVLSSNIQTMHSLYPSRYKKRRVNWSNYANASEALNASTVQPERFQEPALLEVIRRRDMHDSVFSAKVERLTDAMVRKGKVKIASYVADRVVLTAHGSSPAGGSVRAPIAKGSTRNARVLRLEKPRESRRGVIIGGRARFLPGLTRFGSYARNFVCDAATLIERCQGGHSVFLTLTFPGRTDEALDLYSRASGWLVDRFNRWLRYKAADGLFLYVWERTKLGAPHLHYMFKTHGSGSVARISEECQREWRNILLDLCEETRCDVFARAGRGSWIRDKRCPFVAARRVRANHANYLSKYLSKNSARIGDKVGWHPGRWWRVSQPLRKLVLTSRLCFDCRFSCESKARLALTASVKLLGDIAQSIYFCGKNRQLFCLVVSISVPRGSSRDVAAALEPYFASGDVSLIAALRTQLAARAG